MNENNDNPIKELLDQLLLNDYSFNSTDELRETIEHILVNYDYVNQSDIHYLDFDVEFVDGADFIRIIPHNLITALWFSGVFPKSTNTVLNKNHYKEHGTYYSFNEDEKELIINKLR